VFNTLSQINPQFFEGFLEAVNIVEVKINKHRHFCLRCQNLSHLRTAVVEGTAEESEALETHSLLDESREAEVDEHRLTGCWAEHEILGLYVQVHQPEEVHYLQLLLQHLQRPLKVLHCLQPYL
jgi:hypothetical protein